MTKDAKNVSRKEMANAANLFAHPVAGAAAMSAIGIGLASHAFGVWMGALTGAVGVSQRLFDPASSGQEPAKEEKAGTKAVVAAEKPVAKVASAEKPVLAKGAAVTKQAVAAVAVNPRSVAPGAKVQPGNSKRSTISQVTDDLKAIAGVGPKLEQVLNGLGIRSYRQIATWTGEEIAAIEDTLGFKGRIARDDWTGQAAALAGARTKH
jgi:NADH-quinone oxidoreductase subunit E